MDPVFRLDRHELVLTLPAAGVPADWLVRPLSELGLPHGAAAVLRVEPAPAWRWGPVDAAFLAAVLRDLGARSPALELRGLPGELVSLLELSRSAAAAAPGACAMR